MVCVRGLHLLVVVTLVPAMVAVGRDSGREASARAVGLLPAILQKIGFNSVAIFCKIRVYISPSGTVLISVG